MKNAEIYLLLIYKLIKQWFAFSEFEKGDVNLSLWFT